MKLSQYAKEIEAIYRPACNMFHRCDIQNAYTLPRCTIIVPGSISGVKTENVVYCPSVSW